MLETGFICRATHILGWESDPVFYKPKPDGSNRNRIIWISSLASGSLFVIISIIVVCCTLKRKVLIKKTVGNASSDYGYLDVSPYTDASMRLEILQLLTLTGGQIQDLNSYSTLDNSMTGMKRMIYPNAIYNTID
ncbi:unnamed protein product [Lymnaea stagnalis]|uniref:Uncharacterized protein n=1 Tax=Lymnaea stagnalis TaxID=6523 RepID=A0AAV2H4Q1_LYMST